MTEEKARKEILVVGDLVTPTGFSRVLHSLIKFWKKEYTITGLGVNYRGDPHDLVGVKIYPAQVYGSTDSVYGSGRLVDMLNQKKFDVLFILNDAWVIGSYLKIIKEHVKEPLPKIVVYFPVDAKEHDPDWYRDFDIVTKAVTYTEFGRRVVNKAKPDLDVSIMPHGIDNEIFFKKYDSKVEPRQKLFGQAVEKLGDFSDLFIVLNANRNQPRKKLDVTMQGFSLFSKHKPLTVKLYMHCGIVDSHINVGKLAERYGIANRLIVTSIKRGVQMVSDEKLNDIYNACDVGVNTSMGEGWGLTNIEHAITGAPQIVGDHSASREVFHDCGLLIKPVADITFDQSLTVGKLVSAESLAENLEVLYSNRKEYDRLSSTAIKKFSSDYYNWSYIAEKWRNIFEEQ